MTIKIAIAGFGKIARDQHLPAITASDDFELVAIADPAVCDAPVPAYCDLAALLADHPDVDAVSLAMPPRFRSEAARQATSAGKHILIEKPPGITVAEARAIVALAQEAGVTAFTAWHSQEAAALGVARAWLSESQIEAVLIDWKEDVRVWHPGQQWIWQEGGFGVFDPGINALSILTAILPGPLELTSAQLSIPGNCATPIAADLVMRGGGGFPITGSFAFLEPHPPTWDIVIKADKGEMRLSYGGNFVAIDGVSVACPPEAEYAALYARFADLIRAGASDIDLAPLELAEAALTQGSITRAPDFVE